MLKQLLASASTIALLLASSSNAGVKALSASDRVTPPTPSSENATHNSGKPATERSDYPSSIKACKSIPIPRPSVGGTRERMEAIRKCNKARSQEQQTPINPSTTKPNSPQAPSPMR